ncbi:hypothetical protein FJZ31_16500 [Candidatus Poribacteria bacterium]|nr:hypothetical protein [Candidatus Poribacteria bacterium]
MANINKNRPVYIFTFWANPISKIQSSQDFSETQHEILIFPPRHANTESFRKSQKYGFVTHLQIAAITTFVLGILSLFVFVASSYMVVGANLTAIIAVCLFLFFVFFNISISRIRLRTKALASILGILSIFTCLILIFIAAIKILGNSYCAISFSLAFMLFASSLICRRGIYTVIPDIVSDVLDEIKW